MKNHIVAAAVAAALLAGGPSVVKVARAADSPLHGGLESWSRGMDVYPSVDDALSRFGSDVVALGRVDAVPSEKSIVVLGQQFELPYAPNVSVDDYIIVLGDPALDGVVQAYSAIQMDYRYVPGASPVYLRSIVGGPVSTSGRLRLGSQIVDVTPALAQAGPAASLPGAIVELRGIQPILGGDLLVHELELVTAGSLGTGRTQGSLGTGRTEGSLGTGRTQGSLGTGRTQGSLGTGRTQGSLGTGRTQGSLGTGRTEGSLGTGRTQGSLGTGRTQGSLGTGRTEGSLGTGRTQGSLGTGRTQGSLGTGRTQGSLGTGRTQGSLGTGHVD